MDSNLLFAQLAEMIEFEETLTPFVLISERINPIGVPLVGSAASCEIAVSGVIVPTSISFQGVGLKFSPSGLNAPMIISPSLPFAVFTMSCMALQECCRRDRVCCQIDERVPAIIHSVYCHSRLLIQSSPLCLLQRWASRYKGLRPR